MNQSPLTDQYQPSFFGVEIRHSRSEVAPIPPAKTARETITELVTADNQETIDAIYAHATEINKVVEIVRDTEDSTLGLIDLFTAQQLEEMYLRIRAYLGTDIDSHLGKPKSPPGYPFYIGRLATYFSASNDDVTHNFSDFEIRHTNPVASATGPYEANSREYANWANDSIMNQLDGFFQTEFKISLRGPVKKVENGRVSWERGIAECQFIILDFVRDLIAQGNISNGRSVNPELMTVEDIGGNLLALITERKKLVDEVTKINPMLAEQLELSMASLPDYMIEVFHRGRMGTPRYLKEPDSARRAVLRVEALLLQAQAMAEVRKDQAEIPVLDI